MELAIVLFMIIVIRTTLNQKRHKDKLIPNMKMSFGK